MKSNRKLVECVFVWAVIFLVLSGCAVMHKDTDVQNLIKSDDIRTASYVLTNGQIWPDDKWWEIYHDNQLNTFITKALDDSPSMTAATEKVKYAAIQAKAVKASSGLFVGLVADINRQQVSHNGFLSPFATESKMLGTSGPWYTEGTAGLGAEYSIDIWGKDKSLIAAAVGVSHAVEAEKEEVRLVLSTKIAGIYFDIQTMMATRELLKQLQIIKNEMYLSHVAKIKSGLEPMMPAEAASSAKVEIDTKIEQTDTSIKIYQEILRALTGAGPNESIEIAPAAMPDISVDIPQRLGSELLNRRPDLQAMHWYLSASMSRIEAAQAAFYPSFDIKAFFGFDALHMDDVFKRSSQQMNLIPGLSLPIFDSGRLNANLDMTRSQRNILIDEYNMAILNAVSDTARAALRLQSLGIQSDDKQKQLQSYFAVSNSVKRQYECGLLDKISFLESEQPVILQQSDLIELNNQKLHAQLALIAALGGGYQADKTDKSKKEK